MAIPIIASLLVAGCQERSAVPTPPLITDHRLSEFKKADAFAQADHWIRESFAPGDVVIDVYEPMAGLLVGQITIQDGAQTVVGTGMPLQVTVTISIWQDGYRAIFSNYLLPKRWFSRTPAEGKELQSAMQTVHRLDASLAAALDPLL